MQIPTLHGNVGTTTVYECARVKFIGEFVSGNKDLSCTLMRPIKCRKRKGRKRERKEES